MHEGRSRAIPDQGLVIVRVTEDDWRALRDVRLAALAESPAAFGSSVCGREREFDEDRWRGWTRSAALFMALVDGSPVGMAAGVAGGSSVERKLRAMRVNPNWRGSDAAPNLVSSIVDWARFEGTERLRLRVAEGNAPARQFYERLGFEDTGCRKPMPGKTGFTPEGNGSCPEPFLTSFCVM